MRPTRVPTVALSRVAVEAFLREVAATTTHPEVEATPRPHERLPRDVQRTGILRASAGQERVTR